MSVRPFPVIEFTPQAIPEELKALPRWVLWRYVFVKKKWVKIPYQPSGKTASSTDETQWSSFDRVVSVAAEYDGIGFVFNGDGLVGVDLDHAVDDGVWSATADEILNLVGGYAEISPSGEGLHIITRAENIRGQKKDNVEIYSTGRYFTFTGHAISNRSIPKDYIDLTNFLTRFLNVSDTQVSVSLDDSLPKPSTNRALSVMRAALKYVKTPTDEPTCTPYIWAIHHETEGSEEGLALAHDWCSGVLHSTEHPEYEFDYVEERWHRANDDKGNAKTWRSVEYEAKKNGWVENTAPPHPESTENDKVPFRDGLTFSQGFADTEWVVDDVIPRAEVGVIYGTSGSGKTFFAMDLACAIHRGDEWRNKYVQKSDVFYIASEAGSGIKKRIAAYYNHYPIGALPWFVDYQPNLMSVESISDITESIKSRIINPGIIFVDTLALSHDGDENSSQDMSIVLRNLKCLSQATNCVVILIHHPSKTGLTGMRGSGVLAAGCDFVMEVSVDKKTKERLAVVEKLKDGEQGEHFGFKLIPTEVGVSPRGKVITSCYVEHCFGAPKELKPLTNEQQIFVYETFLDALGIAVSMSEEELVEAVQARQKEADDIPARPQGIRRTIAKLVESGHICLTDGKLHPPGVLKNQI